MENVILWILAAGAVLGGIDLIFRTVDLLRVKQAL